MSLFIVMFILCLVVYVCFVCYVYYSERESVKSIKIRKKSKLLRQIYNCKRVIANYEEKYNYYMWLIDKQKKDIKDLEDKILELENS